MTDVYTLTRAELRELLAELNAAYADDRNVRVAIDGGLKFAVGGDTWSLPMGTNTTGRS